MYRLFWHADKLKGFVKNLVTFSGTEFPSCRTLISYLAMSGSESFHLHLNLIIQRCSISHAGRLIRESMHKPPGGVTLRFYTYLKIEFGIKFSRILCIVV